MRLEKKGFSSPDEVRPMSGKGQVEILKVGNGVIGKATFEPGWRWSEHVKPTSSRYRQLQGGARRLCHLWASEGDHG